jgi:PhnB protein
MATIHSYLTFNGNCGEAMAFYRDCLGGELTLQTVSDSPFSENVPLLLRDRIVQATLKKDALVLMASDLAETDLIIGNSVSLLLDCQTEDEARDIFGKLAAGGQAAYPLSETHFGALFGGLVDKFGVNWLLHAKKQTCNDKTFNHGKDKPQNH